MTVLRIILLLLLPILSTAQSNDQEAWVQLRTAAGLKGRAALPSIAQAQEICETGCADSTMGMIYQRLSVAYVRAIIDDNQAISFTDTAISYYTKAYGKGHPLTINCQYNRSTILPYLGRNEEAASNVLTAIEWARQSEDFPNTSLHDSDLAYYHVHLAGVYTQMGDYSQSEVYSRAGLEYADQHEDELYPVKALLYQNLGYSSYLQRNYELALDYYQTGLAYNQRAVKKFVSSTEDIREKIGLSLLFLERFSEAEQHFRFIRNSYTEQLRKEKDTNSYLVGKLAYVEANLMLLLLTQQEWSAARSTYQRAMEYTNAAYEGRYRIRASLFFQRAQVAAGEQDRELAIGFTQQALEELVGTTNLRAVETVLSETPYQLLDMIAFQARMLEEEGRYEEALAWYQDFDYWVHHSRKRFRTAFSKTYLLRAAKPVYEKAIALSLSLYRKGGKRQWLDQAFAFNASNKGALLREDLQHIDAIRFGGIPEHLIKQEEKQRHRLAQLQSQLARMIGDKTDSLGIKSDSLRQLWQQQNLEYDAFLRTLANDYPDYFELKFRSDFSVDIADLQAGLSPGQALVEYFLGEEQLYTFVLTANQFEVLEQPLPPGWKNDFQQYSALLGNSLSFSCEPQFIKLSHGFYTWLFQPVEEMLASEDINRLIIVPDGALKQLPLETLLFSNTSSLKGAQGFLLEKYAISYRYTSRNLNVHPTEETAASQLFGGFGLEYETAELKQLNALGYGDKTGKEVDVMPVCRETTISMRGLGALKYSDDEVRKIANLLGGDQWLNEQATKANFLEYAPDYRLLHLAMHSIIDVDEPLNSALIFKSLNEPDFLLRAVHIYEMQLKGELAVLSACHTAAGTAVEGGSPMSLSRAFHYAGIPAVVASMWALPDFSASSMMPLFYEYLKEGLPIDVALQQAKIKYLNDDAYSSPVSRAPVFWAAPVLVGEALPLNTGQFKWYWWLVGVLLLMVSVLFFRSRSYR